VVAPEVRVNQVGYSWDAPKVAFVMLARPVRAVRFEVTGRDGVAYQGTSADDVGSWNSAYRAVYQLSFSGVGTLGVYQVKVLSPAAASATASYEDNVVAWPSEEPADDYTAGSLFAFALGEAGLG
jgi:endoglucanase